MENLDLKSNNLQEIEFNEMVEIDGGFLPAIAIGVIWGVQLGLSAVGVGMYLANKEK
ncbi:class IIb bacteriocin, lactobin A/cerein 7B family [Sphingobacteriaceae bacterium WQ 2009]|uniref:Class IIb bacteriocin, lactobin A/cerein 7B family n=1 Tax=Rhinopithecimicrobium faecis TaxID=2820698 RepID=A0A8T4H9M3_9SPHI|nr:class IIb bacteriocin, lactobin A/cerein 7B family [Sphingobacteriaceae bacterium WQ 2009]